LSAENVVAVGTAVLGIVASGAMVWYERRVPRRKRIGYRVQMDNAIGDGARSGRVNRRLGLFDETPDMADATLVLLRIENDGSVGIGRDDYTGPAVHGLTAVFTDRTVRGVSVTQPSDTDHIMEHFTAERGFGYEGNTLRIPRVPLNRGDHFKLLVLLSGGDVGSPVRIFGGLGDGQVHPNRSATPDDKPPLFSLPARLLTGLLTLSVLALAGIIVARDDTRRPMGCVRGSLTLTGSTAFQPVLRTLAGNYEKECAGAEIAVQARGSEAGIADLAATGARTKGFPSVIAFSDGPMGARLKLHGDKVALSVFTLVAHTGLDFGPDGLSTAEVRRLYRGEIRRWSQLNRRGRPRLPDLPVVLVSRDAYSGTRQIFQDRVLGGWELAPTTSLDCAPPAAADAAAPVTRCELGSTDAVLDKVAARPGAVGYSELTLAAGHPGVHRVPLDGTRPSTAALAADGYRYRGVEYAYTYGSAPDGSLADAFLTYLETPAGARTIRHRGHLPCPADDGGVCG
jgi:ABC-type phosphate transport system substrate-binding protein